MKRKCLVCGAAFQPTLSILHLSFGKHVELYQKFCSPKCRMTYERNRLRSIVDQQREIHYKLCAFCDKKIESHDPHSVVCTACTPKLIQLQHLIYHLFVKNKSPWLKQCKRCRCLFYRKHPKQYLCDLCSKETHTLLYRQTAIKIGKNVNWFNVNSHFKQCSFCDVIFERGKNNRLTCGSPTCKRKLKFFRMLIKRRAKGEKMRISTCCRCHCLFVKTLHDTLCQICAQLDKRERDNTRRTLIQADRIFFQTLAIAGEINKQNDK